MITKKSFQASKKIGGKIMPKRNLEKCIEEETIKIMQAQERKKQLEAQRKKEERISRNRRIYTEGGIVESILGVPSDNDIDSRLAQINRYLQMGLCVEKIYGGIVEPELLDFFLKNQEERENYFSRFLNRRSAKKK